MKIIKVVLRNDSFYKVDQFKFDAIISSPNQIIMLTDYDGNPTYKGFNKADIVEFYEDKDATDDYKRLICRYFHAKANGLLDRLPAKDKSIGAYAELNGFSIDMRLLDIPQSDPQVDIDALNKMREISKEFGLKRL